MSQGGTTDDPTWRQEMDRLQEEMRWLQKALEQAQDETVRVREEKKRIRDEMARVRVEMARVRSRRDEVKEQETLGNRSEGLRQGWVLRGGGRSGRRDGGGRFAGPDQTPSDYDYGAEARP